MIAKKEQEIIDKVINALTIGQNHLVLKNGVLREIFEKQKEESIEFKRVSHLIGEELGAAQKGEYKDISELIPNIEKLLSKLKQIIIEQKNLLEDAVKHCNIVAMETKAAIKYEEKLSKEEREKLQQYIR